MTTECGDLPRNFKKDVFEVRRVPLVPSELIFWDTKGEDLPPGSPACHLFTLGDYYEKEHGIDLLLLAKVKMVLDYSDSSAPMLEVYLRVPE